MKTVNLFVWSVCLILFAVGAVCAELDVTRAVFCTKVVEQEPVGISDSYRIDEVQKVYLFTEIAGAQGYTPIRHIWYYNDEKVLEVDLTISGPRWRSWSYKNVYPDMKGKWHAEIVDADNNVLKSIQLIIQ